MRALNDPPATQAPPAESFARDLDVDDAGPMSSPRLRIGRPGSRCHRCSDRAGGLDDVAAPSGS